MLFSIDAVVSMISVFKQKESIGVNNESLRLFKITEASNYESPREWVSSSPSICSSRFRINNWNMYSFVRLTLLNCFCSNNWSTAANRRDVQKFQTNFAMTFCYFCLLPFHFMQIRYMLNSVQWTPSDRIIKYSIEWFCSTTNNKKNVLWHVCEDH